MTSQGWFPVLLDLWRRRVVVVGGGATAHAKVELLLAAGAAVTVVSPRLGRPLAALHDDDEITWAARRFRAGDLAGAFVAVAATDRSEVNAQVYREAERVGIPVNAVDDPDHCSFILPAVHREGPVVVTVSTSGRAPAVAVRLRDRIAAIVDAPFGSYVELLGEWREEIKSRFATFEERRSVWYRIVDSDAHRQVRAGDLAAAWDTIRRVLDAASDVA